MHGLQHKVHIYTEYHILCPLVGIGTLLPPLSPASVPLPLLAVLRIRIRIRIQIRQIPMFLGLLDPDPDPVVRGMDPDPSITKQK